VSLFQNLYRTSNGDDLENRIASAHKDPVRTPDVHFNYTWHLTLLGLGFWGSSRRGLGDSISSYLFCDPDLLWTWNLAWM